VQHQAISSPSMPQSRRVQRRTVATSVSSTPGSQSTLIGNCQQTDGFQSIVARRVRSPPGATRSPRRRRTRGGLRKMQARRQPGVVAGAVAEHATLTCLAVTFEAGRSSVAASAASSELRPHHIAQRRPSSSRGRGAPPARADAQAAPTPQASPSRLQEVAIKSPERLTFVDLLHPASLGRRYASSPPVVSVGRGPTVADRDHLAAPSAGVDASDAGTAERLAAPPL